MKSAIKSVVEKLKFAVGAWFGSVTVTNSLVLPVAPSSSVTVRVTVKVPSVA